MIRRDCIPMHLKFFTYTSNAVVLKINSDIDIYNTNNNKMRKVCFESFTCFVI